MSAGIHLRLQQIYAALGQARVPDATSVKPDVRVMGRLVQVTVDFREGKSDAELANIVELLLQNVGRIKDHLNSWCKANGKETKPTVGDALIAADPDVAIIHDLWNRAKHPDLRTNRSGRRPELKDITRAARFTAKPGEPAGMWLGPNGLEGRGTSELVTDADVFDDQGVRIGGLMDILARAITAWERAMTRVGVVLPQPK